MLRDFSIAGCAFVASMLIVGWQRKYALRTGMLDHPNARSSHELPTPRGGGVAIVAVTLVFALVAWFLGHVKAELVYVVWTSGIAVAIVGYIDDRKGLTPLMRFSVHIAAAAWAVIALGGAQLSVSALPSVPAALGMGLLILGACWAINSFNFMDGIDGIAGAELTFIAAAAAALVMWNHAVGDAIYLLCIAAAAMGFLWWNWAPAKIFMGDVGSGFAGLLLAVLALYTQAEGILSIWTWTVLSASFLADATVTLLRRVVNGEQWYAAHRSHSYQRLARRWHSHARVVQLMLAIDVVLLLPVAYLCEQLPSQAPWIASATLALLAIACVVAGAGKPEQPIAA